LRTEPKEPSSRENRKCQRYSTLPALDIVEHEGLVISGVYRQMLRDQTTGMVSAIGESTEAEERFIGIRDFDGTFMVVDHPDTSMFRFKLISPEYDGYRVLRTRRKRRRPYPIRTAIAPNADPQEGPQRNQRPPHFAP